MARNKKLMFTPNPNPAPAKTSKGKKPSLAGLMNMAAASADTSGTKINVAETKRSIRCFMDAVKQEYPCPVERIQFLIKNFC